MKRIVVDQSEAVCRWVYEQTGGGEPARGVGIGLEENGRPLAGVMFDSYNGASVCMHVAAVPGARWMTRDYLWLCFSVPFDTWGVKKIIGLVGSGNLAARRFDEHLGFVLGATLEDAHPDGALLVYTMGRDQCRWLNIRRRNLDHGKTQSSPAA